MKTPRLTPKNVISKARVLLFAAAAVATLAGSSVAEGAAFTWTATAAGNNYLWSDTANWAGGAYPNAAGAVVNINNDIVGDQNIDLPSAGITLGTLNIGDSGGGASNSFTIAHYYYGPNPGTYPLTFQGANAGDATAINGTGLGTSTTSFYYPVVLGGTSPLTITQNAAQEFYFNSVIGNGNNLNLVVNEPIPDPTQPNPILNGGIQILSLSGSGTLTKSGIGKASVFSDNTGFTGNVVIQMGEFQVGLTGHNPSATGYFGTTNYTVYGNSNTGDRLGTCLNIHPIGSADVLMNPSAVVNLAGGGFTFDGWSNVVIPLAFQAINLTQGVSKISLRNQCAVTLSQINRSPGATAFIYSPDHNLGLAADGALVQMKVNTVISTIGGGGDKTTTTGSIVPWMFAPTGGTYTFITQDASSHGLRMLQSAEYVGSIASGSNSFNNISINNNSGDTIGADTTINSLKLYYQYSSSAAFSISSGAKLSVASGAMILQKGNVVGAGTLQFGTTAAPAEGVIFVADSASIAINANIQGSLGLTKSSTGTLILGGSNNTGLTGTVTVAGGILQAGAINALGNNTDVVLANSNNNTFSSPYNNVVTTLNLAGFNQTVGSLSGGGAYGGNVALGGATLTVGAGATPASTTYGGVISGAGNLTKTGASTLTLTGANTYTGATTVSAGTLVAANHTALGTGAVTVAANAGLTYAATSDTTLALGSTLAFSGAATLGGMIGSTTTSAEIVTASNASSTTGILTVNLSGLNGVTPTTGTYTLLHGGGASNTLNNFTSIALGTVINNTNWTINAGTLTNTANDITVGVTVATPLTAAYWTGTSATGIAKVWAASDGSSTSNWSSVSGGAVQGLIPTAVDLTIVGTTVAATNSTLGANMTVKSLTIADATNGLSLNADGNTLTITPASSSAGITVNAGVPASTIAANLALGAAQTWTNNSASTLTVSGIISGSSSLTKAGTGTITLSGANTYTGATTVSVGTLLINGSTSNGSALTVASGGTLGGSGTVGGTTGVTSGTINGSGLVLSGLATFNSTGNTLSGTVTSTTGVTLASGASVTQTGTLTGNLNTTSSGTFTANGTVTGTATVASGGTLAGSGTVGGTTGVTSGTVNGSGLTLTGTTTFNSTGNTLSGTVVSTSGVTLASGAALALNGTLTGSLAVGNGTLTGSGGSVSGAMTLNGGTINLTSGTLSNTLGVTGGNWNGAGSVTGVVTSSSGTLTIGNGANLTANGGLNVTGGTISAGNSASTITGSVNYTSSSSSNFYGVIAGVGKTLILNNASATLTLGTSGSPVTETYTGATDVTAGTLVVNGNLQSSGVTVRNGGTLKGNITAGGTTAILSGGTLSVGNSPGTGSFATLSLAGTDIMEFNASPSRGSAGTDYDTIGVSSSLTYGGDLKLTFSGLVTSDPALAFHMFTGAALAGETGSFSHVWIYGTGGTQVGSLTDSSGTWSGLADLGYGGGTQQFTFTQANGDLIVAVPEPATWALLAFSLTTVMVFRRRRSS